MSDKFNESIGSEYHAPHNFKKVKHILFTVNDFNVIIKIIGVRAKIIRIPIMINDPDGLFMIFMFV